MRRFYFLIIVVAAFIFGLLFSHITRFPQKAFAEEKQINYTLENCLSELDISQVQKTARGWVHWFAPRELTHGLNLKMSEVIAQQAQHGAHSHNSEEIFYILAGTAEFTLKNQTKVVSANSALYCPSGVEHGIRNAGDGPMRYLVIRVDK